MTLRPLAALLALALAGCASVPADRHAAVAVDPSSAALARDIHLASEGWPAAQWWTQYGDPQLDRLVQAALSGAPTLSAARERIASAQAQVDVARAQGGVEAGLEATVNNQRYSANGLFPEPIGGRSFTTEAVRVKAGYDLDLWGRHRAQVAASVGEANARRAEYALAQQSIAAELAQAYFGMQAQLARAQTLAELERVLDAALTDKARRVSAGVSAGGEEQVARAELAGVRQQRAHAQALALRQREAVRALAGLDAGALGDIAVRPLPELPHALPARLGMELLARRADLQAARWRVEASLSRTEAAKAAFYPDINLAASIGLESLSPSRLLQWGSRTMFIGPTVSVPLFDSGRLEAQLGAARSARNEAVADYNMRVFDAVRSVAQAGIDVRDAETQLAEQDKALAAVNAQLSAAQRKLERGLATKGFELAARAASLRQQDAALQLAAQRLNAEVALVRALGGGYRDEDSAKQRMPKQAPVFADTTASPK